MGIDVTLIAGEQVKTQLKVPRKELNQYPMLDGLKPDRETRWYSYFILDGDLVTSNVEAMTGG